MNIKITDVIRTRGCTAWEFSEEEFASIQVEEVRWETGEFGSEVPESNEPAPISVHDMGFASCKDFVQENGLKEGAKYDFKKKEEVGIPEEYDVDVDVEHCIPVSPRKEAGFDYLASLAAEMSPDQDDAGAMAWAKDISPEVERAGLASTLRFSDKKGMEDGGLESRYCKAIAAPAISVKELELKDESLKCAEKPNPVTTVAGFMTGRGKEMHVSKMQLQAARVLLQNEEQFADEVLPGSEMDVTASGFTSGSGASLKIPKSKLNAAAKLFDNLESKEQHANFDAFPKQASKTSRKRSLDTECLSGFSTGSGMKVKISKDKMEAAAQFLAGDDGSNANETPIRQQDTPAAREQSIRKQSFVTPTPIRVMQKTPGGDHFGTRSRFAPNSRQSDPIGPATSFRTPSAQLPVSTGKENLPKTSARKYEQISEMPIMGGKKDCRSMESDETGAQKHKLSISHAGKMQSRNLPLNPNQAETYIFDSKFGAGDVRAHLLSSGAKSDFVTDDWVRNHYKWVVWKLALMEYFSAQDALATALTFSNVQSQIVYRYHKEYNMGHRSFLKGALQRDFPLAAPCILKVSEIRKHQVTAELELTDGWYSITAKCDRLLTQHVNQGRLFLGMKVRITGAEFCGGSPGPPLEATKSTFVILNYNQTHPVKGRVTNLGRQGTFSIPITPISIGMPKGGYICKTVVTIIRKFPPLVWSKLPSGVTTFQTSRSAAISEKIFDKEITNAQAAAEEEIRTKEIEMCKSWLKIGKQGGMTKVDRLYASIIANEDEELLNSLNESDRAELERYITSRQQALQDEQKRMIRENLGTNMPSAPKAKDIETQTLLVGEVRRSGESDHLEFDLLDWNSAQQKTALVTIWRPNEDLVKAKEGQVMSITSLDTFGLGDALSNGFHGHFLSRLHHFQSTSSSKFDVIEIDRSKFKIVEGGPHVTQSVQTLLSAFQQAMPPPNLFDYMGLVIKVGPVYMSSDYKYHYQWIFMIDDSQTEADGDLPWLFALQLCGPENAIKWLDETTEGKVVRCENIEYSGIDNAHCVFRTVGSMATSITNSNSGQNCSGSAHGSLQKWIESHSAFITAQIERAETLMK